jgi:hypothetical protein
VRRRAGILIVATMPPLPQPLSRILAADNAVAAWDARRRREDALTVVIRRHLPRPLANRVRVGAGEGPELELACDAGAIAAIIRQRTPDLLVILRDAGWQFTGIRVRTQVRATPAALVKPPINQPDKEALRPLAGLARDLPPGPLKTALARLLRRLG